MATEPLPVIVRWTRRLEDAAVLDAPVHALEPSIRALLGTGARASVLRGDWLGHAVHELLTDVVIGTWSSATCRPGRGGDAPGASRLLIGIGLLPLVRRLGPDGRSGRRPVPATSGWAWSTR